jgi:PAS domain S-box-containing protein
MCPFFPKEKKMEQFSTSKKYAYSIVGILVFLGLYLTSLYHYLLFHSLVEIFSIVVACGIFMVAWNSRRFLDNNYLLLLGIAYLFAGGLDLIHTLTYKGMGIFQGYGTNLATQLWIAARYTESLSFLIAPLFFRRKLKINLLFFSYLLAFLLLLISIFYWNIFPLCFVEGVGLTPFKKISEYIISLILLAAIALLLKNRNEFDRDVLKWVVWSILLTIASELAFTFYIDTYGFSNLLGHFLKIVSFYLIYKALIEMGLTRPYDLLFRNLKQSEVLLRQEKNKIQNYLDIAGVILVVLDANQTVSLINKKGCETLGYEEEEIIGRNWFDTFAPEGIREEVKAGFRKLIDGEIRPVEYLEHPVLTKISGERMIAWHNAVLRNDKGSVVSTLSSGEDITERKKMEKALVRLASFPELNPNPVVEVDLAGEVSYLNPAAKRLFPDLQMTGLQHPWLVGLESLAERFEQQNERFHIRELRIGDTWYQQTIHYVPEGKRLRIYCLDITERKQIEEKLRRSHDELEIRVQERTTELANAYKELKEQSRILESFFKYTVTPLVFLDRDFNFIRVNEAYAKACRRDASEFPGHNHFEFYPSDAKAKFEQVVQTKEPYVAIAKPFAFPDHPEWGITHWDWILTPILDDAGETEFLVFSLEDVTKRKRAEEALRAAHQYNRSLIEASLDPLVTINADGKIMDVNMATELVAGVLRHQLIGSDFSDYFTDPQKAKEGYEKVFSKGTIRDYPLAIRHTSGMITDVLYNATVYRNEAGEIQGIFAAARDITDRKRAEEALRESENRLRFLSSQLLTAQESERKRIALELHDGIGQMLTAIKFKVESILQEEGKGKGKAKEKSLEAIIPMVRESVDEVRRMQMDLRPSTLDDLGVLATLGWFCREYQKIYSRIRIEKEIAIQENEVSTPRKVVIYRLTQEAMNNIAKHSQADLVRLSLRKQGAQIEWVIEDNGMGFDLEKILSSEGSKRGLGLSSMRERTELSGGKFMIESTQGKGTTIRASWPL